MAQFVLALASCFPKAHNALYQFINFIHTYELKKMNTTSTDNPHIETAILNHVESELPFNQAILLDGKWGSGKTYFIEQIIEKLNHNEEKKRAYRISLFGMKCPKEISEEIFRQVYPLLNSKPVAIGKCLFRMLGRNQITVDDKGNKLGINLAELEKIFPTKGTGKQAVFIFDDIERCDIEISELLGYLNVFIETEEHKVILVANEEKLKDRWTQQESPTPYKEAKEKLVSRTYKIQTCPSDVFDSTLNKVKNKSAVDILKRRKQQFIKIFRAADYNNLRILQYILWDFSCLYGHLPSTAFDNESFSKNFINQYLMLSIEVNAGQITPENFDTIVTNWTVPIGEIILNKYRDYDPLGMNLSELTWRNWLFEGYVDSDRIEKEIFELSYFLTDQPWLKLWDYPRLTGEKLDAEVNASLILLKRSAVNDLYGLLQHISNLTFCSSNGLTETPITTIVELGLQNIDSLALNSNLLLPKELETLRLARHHDIIKGYGLIAQGIDEFETFLEKVREKRSEELNKLREHQLTAYIKNHQELTLPIANKQISIFNLTPEKFASAVENAENDDAHYTCWHLKYSVEQKECDDDETWLTHVSSILKETALAPETDKVRKYILMELVNTIEKHFNK